RHAEISLPLKWHLVILRVHAAQGSITFFLLVILRPPRFALFPYTTLFRSRGSVLKRPAGDRRDGTPRYARVPGNIYCRRIVPAADRKSTRLNSSHVAISYAVFCLKKKSNFAPITYCPLDREGQKAVPPAAR